MSYPVLQYEDKVQLEDRILQNPSKRVDREP
jgi:hypothetical protein